MTASALPQPPTPEQLLAFPAYGLQATQSLYRTHKAVFGAWFFSCSMKGRFDLASPKGTCYVAEQRLGAFMEQFRGLTFLKRVEVDDMRISRLTVPYEMKLADCTAPLARGFGVTAEFHATPDRKVTQAWATAFEAAGFHGVRYFLRNDPASRRIGIALFGSGGPSNWIVASTRRISESLVRTATQTYGIQVL